MVFFAVGMAFLESAVVVYLRELWDIGDSLFPVLPMLDPDPRTQWLLAVEAGREAATLVMLIGVALIAARTRIQRWSVLIIAFGVWDIFYYVWLEVCLAWPASLATWDVLFLLGGQMTGPVYAPVSVSVLMVLGGVLFLRCENEGHRVHFDRLFWALIWTGFVLILFSFYTNGFPSTGQETEADLVYWWPLLVIGDALGLAALLHAVRDLRRKRGPDPDLYQSKKIGEDF